MRRLSVGIVSAGALLFASASPAAAAPSPRACGNGPHGTSHGSVHAHHTVPHRNTQAHQSIPRFCDYPD
jgi:hypothetical protein